MMRYRPPKGTAGLALSAVNGCRREPIPPARMMLIVFSCIRGIDNSSVHSIVLSRGFWKASRAETQVVVQFEFLTRVIPLSTAFQNYDYVWKGGFPSLAKE